jgi:hypothetical protein
MLIFVTQRATLALAMTLAMALVPGRANAAELIMFERQGCPACIAWQNEVGAIWPKTIEARLLVLRVVDADGPIPADLAALGAVRFTPTFVVMACGTEFGRIVGHAGDERFWSLLAEIVGRLKAREPAGADCAAPGG